MLLYSVGAALGPTGGAVAMTLAGGPGLFLFIALCAAAALLFGVWRQIATDPVPADEQQVYQIMPRTTPVAALLDPNSPDEAAPAPQTASQGSASPAG